MTRRKDPRTARSPVRAGELPTFTPVPRQCARHDGWTPDRQRAFIEALADTGSVAAACKAVDMSERGAYHLRRQEGEGAGFDRISRPQKRGSPGANSKTGGVDGQILSKAQSASRTD